MIYSLVCDKKCNYRLLTPCEHTKVCYDLREAIAETYEIVTNVPSTLARDRIHYNSRHNACNTALLHALHSYRMHYRERCRLY